MGTASSQCSENFAELVAAAIAANRENASRARADAFWTTLPFPEEKNESYLARRCVDISSRSAFFSGQKSGILSGLQGQQDGLIDVVLTRDHAFALYKLDQKSLLAFSVKLCELGPMIDMSEFIEMVNLSSEAYEIDTDGNLVKIKCVSSMKSC
jgi:hypothetical protein